MRCIMFVMPVASDTHSHKPVHSGRRGLGTEDEADKETSADLSIKVESNWFDLILKPICPGMVFLTLKMFIKGDTDDDDDDDPFTSKCHKGSFWVIRIKMSYIRLNEGYDSERQ